MKLNQLHLTVDDVPAARGFLERHFGLRPIGEGHKNFDMLLDDDGLVLTLIGVGRSNTVNYPKTFHIGFIQPSDAQVDEINQRLKEDGFDVEAPSHQHGAWSFSFQAPGGFRIAVRGGRSTGSGTVARSHG
ncbi:MAG TPA: VOC family protein [Solirubrobacterales bacterium]|nr:VOC family protein [Solirubrobacterales bacterium]